MVAILNECGLSLERLRLREEKREAALAAQREHLQANLLRAVSHDLRTPLTNISGSAGILMQQESTLDSAARQRLYTGIYDDCSWLINLTENLLTATRIENGGVQMEPELLEDVLKTAVRQVDRRARDHHISVTMKDPMLMARMNAGLILRVNAIQYTPAGSQIALSAERKGDMVEVSISDDGPGIPDEAKKHLFDLFYTAGQGRADCQRGLGLGLNLCQTIITQHGGELKVADHKPRGTVFRFTLPAAGER